MNLRFVEAFTGPLRSEHHACGRETAHHAVGHVQPHRGARRKLGVQLLDRREKQFRLTVAGQRFQQQAVRLLELQRQIKQELAPGAPERALRIGAIESVVHSWLPGWLQQLRSRHPTSSWS
jgi:DNA-binding transcriptional LysR family regulator